MTLSCFSPETESSEMENPLLKERIPMMDTCVFKKCCKKYKRKGRHCKKCPKL